MINRQGFQQFFLISLDTGRAFLWYWQVSWKASEAQANFAACGTWQG